MSENQKTTPVISTMPVEIQQLVKGLGQTADALTTCTEDVNFLGLASMMAERSADMADAVAPIIWERKGNLLTGLFQRSQWTVTAKHFGFAGKANDKAMYTLIALVAFNLSESTKYDTVTYSMMLKAVRDCHSAGIYTGTQLGDRMRLTKGDPNALLTRNAVYQEALSLLKAKLSGNKATDSEAVRLTKVAEHEQRAAAALAAGKPAPKMPKSIMPKVRVETPRNSALLKGLFNKVQQLDLSDAFSEQDKVLANSIIATLNVAMNVGATPTTEESSTTEAPLTVVPSDDNTFVTS